MVKIASPISHLLENKDYAKKIIAYSDCLECRDFSINSTESIQEIFHSEIQPIHEWTKQNIDYLKHIKSIKHDLKLITFHIASCCDKPYLQDRMFEVGGKEYTEEEMLENARKNFLVIKDIFGIGVKIAIENNNYYPTGAYKYVTEPKFISQLVYENDINFLLDIAHARITSHNKRISYEIYKKKLPMDKTIQLHVSLYDIDQNNLAYDTHNYPTEREIVEVKELLGAYEIQYLTIEYYKDINYLINLLERLRQLI